MTVEKRLVLKLDASGMRQGAQEATQSVHTLQVEVKQTASDITAVERIMRDFADRGVRPLAGNVGDLAGGIDRLGGNLEKILRRMQDAEGEARRLAQANALATEQTEKQVKSMTALDAIVDRVQQKFVGLGKAFIGFLAADLFAKLLGFNSAMDALNKLVEKISDGIKDLFKSAVDGAKQATEYTSQMADAYERAAAAADKIRGSVRTYTGGVLALPEDPASTNPARSIDLQQFSSDREALTRIAALVARYVADAERARNDPTYVQRYGTGPLLSDLNALGGLPPFGQVGIPNAPGYRPGIPGQFRLSPEGAILYGPNDPTALRYRQEADVERVLQETTRNAQIYFQASQNVAVLLQSTLASGGVFSSQFFPYRDDTGPNGYSFNRGRPGYAEPIGPQPLPFRNFYDPTLLPEGGSDVPDLSSFFAPDAGEAITIDPARARLDAVLQRADDRRRTNDQLRQQFENIGTNLAQDVGSSIQHAFLTNDWSNIGQTLAIQIESALIQALVTQPLTNALNPIFAGFFGGFSGAPPSSNFTGPPIPPGFGTAKALGGTLYGPHVAYPLGGGRPILLGEAGPEDVVRSTQRGGRSGGNSMTTYNVTIAGGGGSAKSIKQALQDFERARLRR